MSLEEVARRLAMKLIGGEVIWLTGELGSGKTSFTKVLARTLRVKEIVSSPTFTLWNEYRGEIGGQVVKLIHADLYRLTEQEIKREASLEELWGEMGKKDTVVVVEWAERVPEEQRQTAEAWEIEFKHGKVEGERLITVKRWPKNQVWR
jgi:tRNA threonylcarbamoyladenosine biosynthesis protein TsaE